MVGILLDSKYAGSLWCKSLFDSLTNELRKKRIPFYEIRKTFDRKPDAVFIIASDRKWTVDAVTQFNRIGVRPILICNQAETLSSCMYSCVCSDINASMKNLLDTLKAKGKSRIALYGINTDSLPDISRVDSLFNWRKEYFKKMQVFNNNGSLQNCFEDFFPHTNEFDAVICANDFAAISLFRKLKVTSPRTLNDLCIVSCAQTKLSNFYRRDILSLNMNFEQYGKAAVSIYNAQKKHDYISEMTVKVLWTLENDSVPSLPGKIDLDLRSSEDCFYEDDELIEMLTVDKLLGSTDEIEKTILRCLLENKKIEQIAEQCFLSANAVKYRIRKIVSESGAKDREHAVSLLKKYMVDGD